MLLTTLFSIGFSMAPVKRPIHQAVLTFSYRAGSSEHLIFRLSIYTGKTQPLHGYMPRKEFVSVVPLRNFHSSSRWRQKDNVVVRSRGDSVRGAFVFWASVRNSHCTVAEARAPARRSDSDPGACPWNKLCSVHVRGAQTRNARYLGTERVRKGARRLN